MKIVTLKINMLVHEGETHDVSEEAQGQGLTELCEAIEWACVTDCEINATEARCVFISVSDVLWPE